MKYSAGYSQNHLVPGLVRVPLQLLLWAVISLGFVQSVAAKGDDAPLPRTEATESMVLHGFPQVNDGQLAFAGRAVTVHPPSGPCAGQAGHPGATHPPGAPCAGQAGHPGATHPPGGPCAGQAGHPGAAHPPDGPCAG